GGPPFDSKRLRSAPFAEIQRIIRDEDPPRPSMRLRTLAASSNVVMLPERSGSKRPPDSSAIDIARRRRTEPVLLAKSLNGDLDLIVMKCLEKDRNRRYETASALSGDVTRYLAHQPVSASPPSAIYRVRKMVQRHRTAFVAAGVIAAILIGATTVATIFALRESRALAAEQKQRQLAEKAAKETKQVAAFQQTQLAGIDPEQMGRQIRDAFIADAKVGMERAGLSAEEIANRQQQLTALMDDANPTNVATKSLDESIFQRAQQAANEQFKDQPLVRADLLQSLADALHELGLFDRAAVPQEEAYQIRRNTLGPEADDTLASLNNLGELRMNQGKLGEAEGSFREVISVFSRLGRGDDREALAAMNNLGLCLLMQDRREEGQACYRGLVEKYKKISPDSAETQQALSNMGGMLMDAGQLAEAEPFFREAAEGSRRLLGPDDATTILSANNLAILLEKQGKLEEAIAIYRDCLSRSRRARGEDHYETLLYMSNLGFTLANVGKQEEAEALSREALERRKRTLGPDHRDTLQSLHNLGVVLQKGGKTSEAEQFVREALERRRRVFGENHTLTLQSLSYLGVILRSEGKLEEAEPFYRQALERRQRALGRDHPDTIESVNNLGILLIAQGKAADAEPYFREVLALPSEKLAEDHPSKLTAKLGLARSLIAKEQFDGADALIKAVETEGASRSLGLGLKRQLISAHIAYYEARNKSTPTPEYEQLAAQWRSKRDAEQKKSPTSAPAAVP
ncbi:MAG TPA: tetratricopeptide repeat protein, partial [Phycisphaerae bacterium]|nr:tetratricopeptide repeat protein [Phycisphaerae bacterium]